MSEADGMDLPRAAGPGRTGAAAEAPRVLSGPRTWEEAFPRRPKPEGADYGFLSARGVAVASSRASLLHLARTRALPSLAWAPETEEMVPAWEIPWLLDALREGLAEKARREIRITLAASAAALLLLLLIEPLLGVVMAVVGGLLIALVIASMRRRMRSAQRMTAEEMRRGFDALVEQHTEQAQPIPFTRALGYPIIAAGVAQIFFYRASLDAGALDPAGVAAGEWWRLLTAPVLHGGILHFWMNFGALESLGRTMETRGVRGYVPLVFVASALAGGAASLALPPEVRSIGASGGLMGMFGFLAVMAYRRKRHLPEGFLKGLLINIALIGAVGLVAYRFIDNAAHAGGLLAGVLIGLAAVPDDARVPAWTGGRGVERAGRAAMALVYLGAAAAVVLTLLQVTA